MLGTGRWLSVGMRIKGWRRGDVGDVERGGGRVGSVWSEVRIGTGGTADG